MLKYQLWVGPGAHGPGCPWGYQTMNLCPDAINQARMVRYCMDNDVHTTERGRAFVEQMEAAGVVTRAAAIEWSPDTLSKGGDA